MQSCFYSACYSFEERLEMQVGRLEEVRHRLVFNTKRISRKLAAVKYTEKGDTRKQLVIGRSIVVHDDALDKIHSQILKIDKLLVRLESIQGTVASAEALDEALPFIEDVCRAYENKDASQIDMAIARMELTDDNYLPAVEVSDDEAMAAYTVHVMSTLPCAPTARLRTGEPDSAAMNT